MLDLLQKLLSLHTNTTVAHFRAVEPRVNILIHYHFAPGLHHLGRHFFADFRSNSCLNYLKITTIIAIGYNENIILMFYRQIVVFFFKLRIMTKFEISKIVVQIVLISCSCVME